MADDPNKKPPSSREMAEQAQVGLPSKLYEQAGQNLKDYSDVAGAAGQGVPGAMENLSERSLGAAMGSMGPAYKSKEVVDAAKAANAPTFYSKMVETIKQKMGGSATPEQIQGMLREIKPEELQYSGLNEFLKGKTKVGRDELLGHVEGRLPKIEEVVKGEGKYNAKEADKLADKLFATPFRDLAMDERNRILDMLEAQPSGTKFHRYTLPGGENYREMLFTMPRIENPSEATALANLEQQHLMLSNKINSATKSLIDQGVPWDQARKVAMERGMFTQEEAARVQELSNQFSSMKQKAQLAEGSRNYRSSHWDEPNVLAHTRMNDRIDPQGKKHLFVEEIQSDWHQAGRNKGYKSSRSREEIDQELSEFKNDLLHKYVSKIPKDRLARLDAIGQPAGMTEIDTFVTPAEKAKYASLAQEFNKTIEGVPDAPFKKTWHEMVAKRLLREASEGGYDHLSWTTGAQQAERYDLSKQVSQIKVLSHGDGTVNLKAKTDSGIQSIGDHVSIDKLDEYVGKDLAAKIRKDVGKLGNEVDSLRYQGVDLKVGGEGMKGFYDKILPDYMNKIAKKYGAKVEEGTISGIGDEGRYRVEQSDQTGLWYVLDDAGDGGVVGEAETERGAEKFLERLIGKESSKVHTLRITPEMRQEILKKGFPQFAEGGMVMGGVDPQQPQEQQQEQQQEPDVNHIQGVPVINPDGNIVAIDPQDLQRALAEGYTQASPDDVHKHLMERKYGGIGQQALTGLEGAAEGVSFGTSTGLETAMGVSPEDILGRKIVNPGTHILGEVGGLAASALIPVAGEANILRAAGEMGAGALGLGKGAAFIDQVGAHAVKGAIEAGLFQGGEEISNAFAKDPNQTAEHAVADLGLAAVMGGVFGGALGAASKGLKKREPTFVSELDRPAMEAGDFRASIENSNLLKDHEKVNILEGLAREKPDAKEIRAAGERLGAPVMEGMTSDSFYVQKAEDSLINGVPTYSGLRRKAMYEQGYQKAVSVLDEAIGAEGQYSKAELGNVLKTSITQQLEEQNAPIKAMYDQLKLSHEVIPLEEKLVGKMAERLGSIQELRVAPSSPEGKLVRRVMKEMQNLKTVDDVKVYAPTLSLSPTASSGEKRMAGILRDVLKDLEEGSIERFAYDVSKTPEAQRGILSLIDQRKAANSQYKELIQKVQRLSEQLGKGRVHGLQDAIHFIQDKVTPEEVTSRLFAKKDSEFLKFFDKEFPQEMELMRSYQKAELREAASKTGTFSPKVFFNNVNKLEPEVQKTLFSPDQLAKIQDAETYIRAFPKNFNPSGTAGMDAFRAFFEHPMGAAIANIRDMGIEKFIKWASQSTEVQHASELAKATVRGWNKAAKAIRSVFDPTKDALPSNVIELTGRREKLDKLVAQYRENPEKMTAMNDNNPSPEYSAAFATTSSRALQYLTSLKPNEDPQNALDSKLVPSKAALSAYNRALDIAQNPLTVLKNVKDGSLTIKDLTAMQAMYPGLYESLSQKLQMQLIETKSAGKPIPYKTRIGLSTFLMAPIDSTFTSQGITFAQQTMAPQQQPGAPQQGASPRSPASLSKLPQTYQTPGQSRDARSQKH